MSSVAGRTTWLYVLLGPLLASGLFTAVHMIVKPQDTFVAEDIRGIALRIAAGGVLFVFIATGIALVGAVLKRVPFMLALLIALVPFTVLWIMDLQTMSDPAKDYMRDVPYGLALTIVPTLIVWLIIRVGFGQPRT